jgi:GTPase SAR1 family protein
MGVAWSSRAAAKRDVRVAVIGDHGTGKSSLVATITTGRFPDQDDGVARVLPPARLPVTIVDTSSRYVRRRRRLSPQIEPSSSPLSPNRVSSSCVDLICAGGGVDRFGV